MSVKFRYLRSAEVISVGKHIREFRTNLHKYIRQTSEPIAITFHGEAVGYYVPTKPGPQQQDLAALQEAVRKIAALLGAHGISEEEIMADFQEARQHDPQSYKSATEGTLVACEAATE